MVVVVVVSLIGDETGSCTNQNHAMPPAQYQAQARSNKVPTLTSV